MKLKFNVSANKSVDFVCQVCGEMLADTKWENKHGIQLDFRFVRVCHLASTARTRQFRQLINYKIKKYIILQRRYKKLYNENPTPINKNKNLNTKKHLDEMFKNAREEYYGNICENLKNENYTSRKFWNICNNLLKRKMKANVGDIIFQRKIYKNDKDKVRIIGDYFAEQVTSDDGYYKVDINYSNNFITPYKYTFPMVTKTMIKDQIKNINIHTATGPDNISNIFIKETGESLLLPLGYIFNYSLLHGTYPQQWKLSHWTPLHKKDSIYKRKNYRPISLCNNLGKLLDKIIFKTFYQYLEHINLLNENNYGFKRKSSCQHNLSMLLHNIYDNLDKNCDSLILFLDVVKAFDKVDHKILLQKINYMGVDKIVFKWFKNYLQDRYSRCVIHGYESELYHVQSSVTQGSVLATLLWSIFAYDITENIISNPYIFADDTALAEKIERDDTQNAFNIIQFDIDQLLDWSKNNKIEFSTIKTKCLIVSNSHLHNYPNLYMDNVLLQRVANYKQLGLFIDENLNWEAHINYIIHKTQKIIHMFKLLRYKIDFVTSEKLYKGLIASILDYCCMFYVNSSQKNIKRITRLIYHCALILVKGTRFISETKLLQELGWNNFIDRTNYLSITMFAKIKLTQTPKIIYETLFVALPTNIGRNVGKLKIIFSKKNKFYNSFYLKMIRLWNTLQKEIRLIENYPDFLDCMHKKYMLHQYKKINLFKYDTDIDSIFMKLRFHCSTLNADQFKFNFTANTKCMQCHKNKQETIHHYFMDCVKYVNQRKILKHNISRLHQKFEKLNNKQLIQLIQGHTIAGIDDYIYKNTYQYIKLFIVTAGRFAN